MSSSIVIRSATSGDLPQLKELHASLIPVSCPNSFFINQLIHSGRAFLIAVDESQSSSPVAFVTAKLANNSGKPSHIEILSLGVIDQYQKQGLARQLVREAITTLTPEGLQLQTSTHVRTTNTPAQTFYENLGMKTKIVHQRPVVARNVLGGLSTNQTSPETLALYRSRDAYVMEGIIA